MKSHYTGFLAYSLVSALSMTLVVACGQSKTGARVVSKISVQKQQAAKADTANSQSNLRFAVTVTDQKPLLSLMQIGVGEQQINSLVNNPKAAGPVQEAINMDLNLRNLNNTLGASGDGSVLKLKAVLSNSVDQPIALLMASKSATVNVTTDDKGQTKMTANFLFLPEYSMQTSSMKLVLDGAITTNFTMIDSKIYSGTLAIVDDSNQSAIIGSFSIPLSQIVSAEDAARLGASATAPVTAVPAATADTSVN
jgi:hypothetical protein